MDDMATIDRATSFDTSTCDVAPERSTANSKPVEPAEDLTQIRRLAHAVIEATHAAGALRPGDAEEAAREEALRCAEKRFAELEKRIYAKPVRSLSDLQERAEIAAFWIGSPDELEEQIADTHGMERSTAQLVAAVLALSKKA